MSLHLVGGELDLVLYLAATRATDLTSGNTGFNRQRYSQPLKRYQVIVMPRPTSPLFNFLFALNGC